MVVVDKSPIDVRQYLYDSFVLAKKIYDSHFHPDFLVALWRGGTPVGLAVHEFFAYKGVKIDHAPPVRTEKYHGIDQESGTVKVYGLEYLIAHADAENSALVVDDIYDTGESIQALRQEWKRKARRNIPGNIRIATVYYKPSRNKTNINPDYFVHLCGEWMVFPHELMDLTLDEIAKFKGNEIAALLK